MDTALSKTEEYCASLEQLLSTWPEEVLKMQAYTGESSILKESNAQDLLLEVIDLIDVSRLFFILHMNRYKYGYT